MKYCIPDELFNRIPFPESGAELATLDGIYAEIAYKFLGAEEVPVKKEIWHSLVDFCARTGAYFESATATGGQVALTPMQGKFLRAVGASVQTESGAAFVPTACFSIAPGDGGALYATFAGAPYSCKVVMSVRPRFDDATLNADGKWEPKAPQYLIDRYGECIAHGALARIYAQRGDAALARMHATAYNNDLNRLSFGLITSGMRKHLLIDIEDWLVNTTQG